MNARMLRTLPALALALASFGSAAAPYEVVPVAGGGRVEGKVTFLGEVSIKKIVPNKDVEICGGPRDEAQITVGPDKGVKDAVVYLKAVPKGKAWGPMEAAKPVLDQEKCIFKPVVQVMKPGALNVLNSDATLHTSHGYYGTRNAFNIAMPEKGMTVKKDLPIPGAIRVQCDTHNWMHSWLFVADSPYYVVTGADGSYSLTDVPPGTYTLVAFQRHTGPVETSVTVKGGEAVKVALELKK